MDTLIRKGRKTAVLLFGLFSASILASTDSPRPNVLFCLAEDHSYAHTSFLGCPFVKTAGFDRVARSGVFFRQAYASAPSCAPSRAAILTGKPFYLTRRASMNHGFWDPGQVSFVQRLQHSGYHVGYTGKGWGPGKVLNRDMPNPAGYPYNQYRNETPGPSIAGTDYTRNFQAFLDDRPAEAPFCFWVGFSEPHRPLDEGIGLRHGKPLSDVVVPRYYPDLESVRSDLLDYAFEIEWLDRHIQRMLDLLTQRGLSDTTLVILTSDNGMAFPRAKTSNYDAGVRMPLAMMWPAQIRPGRVVDDFVPLYDLAPTVLDLAGLPIPVDMVGSSLVPILLSLASGCIETKRDHVITGLERHGGIRTGGPDYPVRTYRTADYLFIKNYHPKHPPAGPHPGVTWPRNGPVGGYGYVDGCPTKTALWEHRGKYPREFKLCLKKRPQYELYDVHRDPDQIHNLAYLPEHRERVQDFESRMEAELKATGDPRMLGNADYFEGVREAIEAAYLAQSKPAGTDYYLSASSGDDRNLGTSPNAPWRTLDRLDRSSFKPGDRIHFKRGDAWTGYFRITESGEKERPIKLTCYGRGTLPRLSNPHWDFARHGNVIRIDGAHIVVEYLHFHDGPEHPFEDDKEKHLTVYSMGAVNFTRSSSYGTLQYCEIENYPVGVMSQGPHNRIYQNHFHNCNRPLCLPYWGPIAIFVGGPDNEICFNYVVNYQGDGSGGYDGGAFEVDRFYWGGEGAGADNITYHHNCTLDNAGHAEPEAKGSHKNLQIYKNFSNDYKWFVEFLNIDTATIRHCVSFRTLPRRSDNDGVLRFSGSDFRIYNNIFVVAENRYVFRAKDENLIAERKHNLYYNHDRSGTDPIGLAKQAGEEILNSPERLVPALYTQTGAIRRPEPDDKGIVRVYVPTDTK